MKLSGNTRVVKRHRSQLGETPASQIKGNLSISKGNKCNPLKVSDMDFAPYLNGTVIP